VVEQRDKLQADLVEIIKDANRKLNTIVDKMDT
jgi:hypothetical protein